MSKKMKYAHSYSNFEKILSDKGITPYKVASDLKISPMTLSDWKNGKSKPKLDKMVKISNYLGVDVSNFVD